MQASAKPPRRSQQQRRETTRRHLLDAAIDCIHDMGLAGAIVSVIADRAGVTRGAVQHHFGNRNDLVLALIEEIGEKLFVESDKVLATRPIKDRVAVICEQYWETINSRHSVASIHLHLGTMHDADLHPRIYDAMRKAERRLDNQWLDLFKDRKLPAARVIAARHLVLATMRGLVLRQIHRKARHGWDTERALLRETLERMLSG